MLLLRDALDRQTVLEILQLRLAVVHLAELIHVTQLRHECCHCKSARQNPSNTSSSNNLTKAFPPFVKQVHTTRDLINRDCSRVNRFFLPDCRLPLRQSIRVCMLSISLQKTLPGTHRWTPSRGDADREPRTTPTLICSAMVVESKLRDFLRREKIAWCTKLDARPYAKKGFLVSHGQVGYQVLSQTSRHTDSG